MGEEEECGPLLPSVGTERHRFSSGGINRIIGFSSAGDKI